MPKMKKTKFYSCQHRNKRLKQALREIEIGDSHNELEKLDETETSMSESANSSDRQLYINEDVLFQLEYNEACNQSIQNEVQEVSEEEEKIEEEEEEAAAISLDEYDSEDSSELERDVDNGINIDRLKTNLVQWSHKNNIYISAVTNLLHALRKEDVMKSLPRDGRTLLKTPRKSNVIPMEHGEYCHFGIEEGLRYVINVSGGFRCLPEEIHLSVNIDGLPLAKSSKSQLWPILGSFRNFVNKTPFLIGAFHGYKKPAAVELFLHYFIEEAENLVQNGFTYADNNIPFYIDCFICDAPARAYICCVKGHSGYYGCSKCETTGIYRGKVVFPEMNAPLRTAESFINQTQAQHHTGISPLLRLNIDMISQIPLDYMHLVILGQVRKMLKMMTGNLNPMKLGAQQVLDMSRRQLALRTHIPFEFARKPRSLDELERMKATEHREFALYTGGVVLRKIVRQGVYEHFLKLSVAIRILATPGIDMEQNRYAKHLLEEYFTDFLKLYGENNATYNTHGLLHLADDALKWGALDTFSAFIFENYLQQIKKIVRSNDKPLQQLSNRISEIRNNVTVETVERIETYKLGKQCYNGCLINDCTAPMYKKIQFQYFTVTTKAPNNCCIMKDDSIVMVNNICHRNNRIVIIAKIAKNGKPFFNSPAPSTCFGILQFSGEYSSLRSFPIEDIQNKGVVLPIFDESYAFEHRNNNIMTSQFCIVHFTEDDSVEVVPDFWINESSGRLQCYWPKTSFPTKNVIRRTVPEEHWTTHKCRILGTFDDFDTARSNLNQAEISSDFPSKILQTGKRLRRRNRRYFNDDDSSDDAVSEKNTLAAPMYNSKLSTYKSSKNTASNSSSGDEDKENKLEKSNSLKLPAAFEDKNKRVVQANVTPYEVLRKKSSIISTKSSQNQRNIVDEDYVRQGCSKDHRREEQRSKPLNHHEKKSQITTYIGETEFEKRVIRDLTKVKLDIQEIRDVIVTMQQDALHQEDIPKRNIKDTKQDEEMENILPAFPLKTLQDWNELEMLLSNNKAAREQLEKMFSNRGGKNGGDLIRRILGTVFSPQLAVQFSWQGRKNNEKVEGSVVARTIFVATKHKFKIDDREMELSIINWFRRASERIPKKADNIEIVQNN